MKVWVLQGGKEGLCKPKSSEFTQRELGKADLTPSRVWERSGREKETQKNTRPHAVVPVHYKKNPLSALLTQSFLSQALRGLCHTGKYSSLLLRIGEVRPREIS